MNKRIKYSKSPPLCLTSRSYLENSVTHLPESLYILPRFGRHYRSLVSCRTAGARRCVGFWPGYSSPPIFSPHRLLRLSLNLGIDASQLASVSSFLSLPSPKIYTSVDRPSTRSPGCDRIDRCDLWMSVARRRPSGWS
ncbi:hypothetical protein VTN49DRAFT_76 [Thermomyces lanuginosus]|uniref:uncharacterized protein n=1 Tax=Thermomyces lanuginosus TaxID=5541 RepID=UPI0037426C3E